MQVSEDFITDQLEFLIRNSTEIIKSASGQMERYSNEENYILAAEMKVCKAVHESYVHHISRILKGLTPFENMQPQIAK
jgi:hypothetical protein